MSSSGRDEPLDVHDVRRERLDAAEETADAWQVLRALHDPAQSGARLVSQQSAGPRDEHLLTDVAVRARRPVEQERRGQEVHVVATLAERRGEAVVVGRREAERVDEGDPHAQSLERR